MIVNWISRRPRALLFGPASTGEPKVQELMPNRSFRVAYADVCTEIGRRKGFSPHDEATNAEGAAAFHRRFLREAALQLATYRALIEQGHVFRAAAGISLGEIAAAHATGAIDVDESITIACGMADAVIAATGGDLIVADATLGKLRRAIGELPSESVIQWPSSSVVAVRDIHMRQFFERCQATGIEIKSLGIRCMPHTSGIGSDAFRISLNRLKGRRAELPFYSCVRGDRVTGLIDRDFWIEMIARGVDFSAMHNALHRDGLTKLVHVGSVSLERQAFGHLSKGERPRVVRGSKLVRHPLIGLFH